MNLDLSKKIRNAEIPFALQQVVALGKPFRVKIFNLEGLTETFTIPTTNVSFLSNTENQITGAQILAHSNIKYIWINHDLDDKVRTALAVQNFSEVPVWAIRITLN